MLKVYFGDKQVRRDSSVPYETAQQGMKVLFSGKTNKLYTLVFYDVDAPEPPPNNKDSPYLHYLLTNIPGNDIKSGFLAMDYQPPSPPSGQHNYVMDLYVQKDYMRNTPHRVRKNFQLSSFIDRHELSFVDRVQFNVASTARAVKANSPRRNKPTPRPVSPHRRNNPNSPRIPVTQKSDYFKKGHDLSDQEKRYCRCVLHVGEKNVPRCNRNLSELEKKRVGGKQCVNPYAACSKTVGREGRRPPCGQWYNFDALSDSELTTYSSLMDIKVPKPYDRDQMLDNIASWKSTHVPGERSKSS